MKVVPIILRNLMNKSYRIMGSSLNDQYQTYRKIKDWYPDLDTEDLTPSWVDDFNRKLLNQGLSPNTIWKHHKNTICMIKGMIQNGNIKSDPYFLFENKQYNGDKLYITDDEIRILEKAILDDELGFYRDMFLLGYYTMLRYSDLIRVSKDHISIEGGKKYLKIHALKTGSRIVIPVGERLEAILNRIDIRPVKNEKLNRGIQRLFKEVGIHRTVEVMYFINNNGGIEKKFQRVPIYNQVTIHCARRSGICSLVKSGVSMIKVMAFSGHKTETALMSYVGIDTTETAHEMSTHKFFA